MRRAATAALALLASWGVQELPGQVIQNRVGDVHDGFIRMAFAAREGVCGSGANGFTMHGKNDAWEPDCGSGPVLVMVEKRDGEIVDIDTYVGGRWRQRSDVIDLGVVSAPVAARFFLQVARSGAAAADDALLPAALADSVTVWPEMSQIARDQTLSSDVREKAIFWLGQGPGEDHRYLHDLYTGLRDDELKERVIFSVSQNASDDDWRWLLARATSDSESMELRKKALFWAGQSRHDMADLVALYDRLDSSELKERLLFVFSQKHGDEQALDKLIRVARDERDRDLRRRAIFWLGQSKDPRAVQFLSELIG